MQEFHEGDLVEAVRGETVIRGRASHPQRGREALGISFVGIAWYYLDWLADHGFTLTVIEKAAPPLPTEKGWYLANTGEAVYLAADGYWTAPASFGVTGEDMGKYAPFTRLEPVPATAKRVVDWIDEWEDSRDSWNRQDMVKEAYAEFGVTE